MSDSSGGNQFVAEVKGAVAEVAKDVTDSVGEAIEQGVQSVTGSALTPQQVQQQQQEDQKKLVKVRKDIAWMRNVDESQKVVRQVNTQKEDQRVQAAQQQVQERATQQSLTSSQNPDEVPEEVKRTLTELKQGKGVGG